jgi:hypothetical protein
LAAVSEGLAESAKLLLLWKHAHVVYLKFDRCLQQVFKFGFVLRALVTFLPVNPVFHTLPGGDNRYTAGIVVVDPGLPGNVTLSTHGLTPKIIEKFKGLLGGVLFKLPFDDYFNRHGVFPYQFEMNVWHPEYNHFIENFYQ